MSEQEQKINEPRIVGAKSIVCTCGREMVISGGGFGETCYDTYLCKICDKAVNVLHYRKNQLMK